MELSQKWVDRWVEVCKGSVEDCWLKFKTLLTDLQQRFIFLVKYRKNSTVPSLKYTALKSVKKAVSH